MKTSFLKLTVIWVILFCLGGCNSEKGLGKKNLKNNSPPLKQRTLKGLNLQSPLYIKNQKKGLLLTPKGSRLTIKLALSKSEQTVGLSGLKPSQMSDEEGLLFYNLEDEFRRFWMPDTYFDLDIFFLDKNFKVLNIDRDVPHHPGRENNPPIARTISVFCRHVLEIKSSSKIAKEIKIGDLLEFKSDLSTSQIESKIRQAP